MLLLFRALLVMGTAGAWLGCDKAEVGARPGAVRVVDSFIPRDSSIQRFRKDLKPVAGLEHGYGSRDSLLAAYVRALAERDTGALASMAVSRAEFAYLYYPTAAEGLPPYDLEPGLMWDLLQQRSELGIRRALDVYGGQRLKLLGHECGTGVSREGANTVAGPCVLRLRDQRGQAVSVRVLNQILERGGRYKILSYANKL
jgi:hypothetical protein